MSWSSLYVQILISLAIAIGVLILTIIDILPLRVLIGLVPILIFLAILRNSIDKRTNKKAGVSTNELPLEEFTFVDPPGYYTHPKYSYPICPNCLNKTKLISAVAKVENAWYCTVCDKPMARSLGEVFTTDW